LTVCALRKIGIKQFQKIVPAHRQTIKSIEQFGQILHDKKICTFTNTDGLINWLRQPGLLCNLPKKAMRKKYNLLIISYGTMTDPAAETKSIGLSANALVPCFCLSSGQFYHDKTTIVHIAGLAKNAAPRHGRQLN
jgi:hypothetical protein